MNDNFDLVWNEGDTYVLTWKNSGKSIGPIPQVVIREWSQLLDKAFPELYARIKSYYDKNQGAPYPVYTDPNLPPIPGWQ